MTGFKYHVFLSHSSPDKPLVEELAVRLRLEGIEPWLDKWNLVPGEAWQPAIEQALNDCATCAVAIGAGGFGAWQNEEMRVAIDRKVASGKGQFRVIPILLPGVDRPERGKLPEFLVATTWVEFRRTLDDAEAFRRLVCGIRGVEPGAGPDRVAIEGACPYRGLEVFDVEHAPFFFGREALTEWLTVALRRSPTGEENRFLAILGASGSGKSSLARAGLAAALKKGALEGSADWPIVIFKPGRAPIESLSLALAALPGGAALIKDTRDLLNIQKFGEDPKSLHTFAKLALRDRPQSPRLVVLVDQAEEVFTLCEDPEERRAFFDTLLHAFTVADGQVIVVLTIRADFYGKCAPYPALAALMSDHQLLVGPMSEDELSRAIERPALLAGGEFEPGLVGMLLQDVEGQAGALPLLQFTLMDLWERREGRRMTVSAYESIGGLQGALKKRADDVLGQFDESKRELCRRIFLRLTQPGEGSEDTKRRAMFGELVPAGADPLAVEAVVRRLADARLITIEADAKAAGSGSVEVAHEALIRSWSQLRGWIDADRAGLRLQRQLTEAAREWEAHGREGSFLYAGSRLTIAQEWARTHPDGLNELEARFLAASLRRRKIGKIAQAGSILVVMALILGGWDWVRIEGRAQHEQLSESVDGDLQRARTLSIDAHWPEAVEVLKATLNRLGSGVENESLRSRVADALKVYTMRREQRDAQEGDRKLVAAIEDARLLTISSTNEGGYDRKASLAGYQRAFHEGGIDVDRLSPEAAAELIRAKPPNIRDVLAAALDDWAFAAGPPNDSRLSRIAREADPDPWRSAIREAVAKKDTQALRARARDPEIAHQSALTLNRLSRALLESGYFDEGIALSYRAQQLHPHDLFINLNLAIAFVQRAMYNESVRYSLIAVALRPESALTNGQLSFALIRNGQVDQAFFYCDKAIRLQPDAVAYRNRGLAWDAKRDYDKAIDDYDKAIKLNPRFALAYNPRGYAWYAKGEHDKAFADFDKAIELDPRFAMAYMNRGIAWNAKGEFNKAIADLDKAIKFDPNLALAYRSRGITWNTEREFDKAIADFDKAIKLEPRFALAYNPRGYAWNAKGEHDKAIADYNKAIEFDPKFALAYINRAVAWDARGEYDKAIADFDKAIELDPKNHLVLQDRAKVWRQKGEYDKAIADYEKALSLEPALAPLLSGFAWMLATCPDAKYRDGKRAVELATRACESTAWKQARILDTLAAAFAETGDFVKAIEWQEKALELWPNVDEHVLKGVRDRLALYKAGKPFHEEPKPETR